MSAEKKKGPGRGGRRPGAGRPPRATPGARRGVTLDDRQWARVEGYRRALGVTFASEALQAIIDAPADFGAWVRERREKAVAGR